MNRRLYSLENLISSFVLHMVDHTQRTRPHCRVHLIMMFKWAGSSSSLLVQFVLSYCIISRDGLSRFQSFSDTFKRHPTWIPPVSDSRHAIKVYPLIYCHTCQTFMYCPFWCFHGVYRKPDIMTRTHPRGRSHRYSPWGIFGAGIPWGRRLYYSTRSRRYTTKRSGRFAQFLTTHRLLILTL